ncbi:hypothetical protein FGG08_003787 [Glutinoglossum americanum]|uniref:NAD(+) diphosphatase n=1 Tax=Glutinoglossum americanum TaxID=1670608 RepID=A0A9P8L354_9PEZI|nr:hypothetical protein FGG08_003787 [Glutinoglossum americanum]
MVRPQAQRRKACANCFHSTLSQWPLDFEGNTGCILESIRLAKPAGVSLRVGPGLEITYAGFQSRIWLSRPLPGGIRPLAFRILSASCLYGDLGHPFLTAAPTAELELIASAQNDEVDMDAVYDELSVFDRLRKVEKLGLAVQEDLGQRGGVGGKEGGNGDGASREMQWREAYQSTIVLELKYIQLWDLVEKDNQEADGNSIANCEGLAPLDISDMLAHPDPSSSTHHDLDSILSRKSEVSNYFSGSPLNRVAFLRSDHEFLSHALQHLSASFLLFSNLAPFTTSPTSLAYATYADVTPLIGEDLLAKNEEDMVREYNSEAAIPLLVFLGLDEEKAGGVEWGAYTGAPQFALDITPKGTLKEKAEELVRVVEGRGWKALQGRTNLNLDAPQAATYAQARSMIDWNDRNPFCASCGHKTLSVNAGYKRVCPPTDLALPVGSQTRPPCVTRTGVHNLAFPRTDPTVIAAVVSSSGTSLLLGRKKRWPPHWYSTLAGFVEPAESVEEAVRREIWEESGVKVGRVVIHSTQPWPYPANLMIGAVAQAVAGDEEIHLKHDPELEDAKWVSIEEVAEALGASTSGIGEGPGPEYKEGGLRLPPPAAIANRLLTAVVEGILGEASKI